MVRKRHQALSGRALGVIFGILAIYIVAMSPSYGCSSDGGAYSVIIECQRNVHHGRGAEPSADMVNSSGSATYSYVWVPNCAGALPSDHGIVGIDCRAAHSCTDVRLISMSLYARQLTDASGRTIKDGWTYLGSECRNPSDAGPTKQPRTLTWSDVLSAIRQVGVPAASVRGPRYTLVNLDTTFYTDRATIDRPLTIIGYDVEVHVQPSTYTWHWGDGTGETTDTPGRPYPSTEITHTYDHATASSQPMQLSVDVTYTARYRVNDGDWEEIPQALTIAGQPTSLPVKQASAVLVADN
jgi:hypothetical protein